LTCGPELVDGRAEIDPILRPVQLHRLHACNAEKMAAVGLRHCRNEPISALFGSPLKHVIA
jgi:hypothetical protein